MVKFILYHGTSEKNARQIEEQGFKTGINHNWKVKSKSGFVYLSSAYAPFYAMNHKTNKLALIKCEVNSKNLFPEDDFLMFVLRKPKYSQKELDKVKLERWQGLWKASLEYMGNVAVKPSKIKILGIRYFNGKNLLYKCDPSITPLNFKIMGEYYKGLTEWIFEGNEIMKFKSFMTFLKIGGET